MNEKQELRFTWVLILACACAYGAALIPLASDVLNMSAFVIALALFGVVMASGGMEEAEWNVLFARSHVQQGLQRLSIEALQEDEAGRTEEGGFAVEEGGK